MHDKNTTLFDDAFMKELDALRFEGDDTSGCRVRLREPDWDRLSSLEAISYLADSDLQLLLEAHIGEYYSAWVDAYSANGTPDPEGLACRFERINQIVQAVGEDRIADLDMHDLAAFWAMNARENVALSYIEIGEPPPTRDPVSLLPARRTASRQTRRPAADWRRVYQRLADHDLALLLYASISAYYGAWVWLNSMGSATNAHDYCEVAGRSSAVDAIISAVGEERVLALNLDAEVTARMERAIDSVEESFEGRPVLSYESPAWFLPERSW